MTLERRRAVIIGVLFLVATASYMAGSGMIESVLETQDFLDQLLSSKATLLLGILLECVNIAAVVGIGVLMIPIVQQQNTVVAFGYAGSRIIEAALLTASEISVLALIPVAGSASSAMSSDMQILADFAVQFRFASVNLAMLALGIGSLFLLYVFIVSRLIPRILSIIGVAGYISLLASVVLGMFGIDTGFILFLPGAIFEVAFPVWLFVKGFSTTRMIQAQGNER